MSYCAGCRPRDRKCALLKKRCALRSNHKVRFCYECDAFPCKNLQRIDARYKREYRMSFVENLSCIHQHSLTAFVERENIKWQCQQCKGVVCCHNGVCFDCSIDTLRAKKKLYRWEDESRDEYASE